MRYKEIDINIKAIPEKEDEALLNQLMGAKKATASTDTKEKPVDVTNADNPGKVASDDPNTKAQVFPPQQELELKKKLELEEQQRREEEERLRKEEVLSNLEKKKKI